MVGESIQYLLNALSAFIKAFGVGIASEVLTQALLRFGLLTLILGAGIFAAWLRRRKGADESVLIIILATVCTAFTWCLMF